MNELLERGLKVVPVTIWGDEVVVGFNAKELARLFDLSGDVPVATPTIMVDKYDTVLTAACRAVRQIPPEYLDWESPERSRPLRTFTFHIMDRPDRALNAYRAGMYSSEDRGRDVRVVLGDAGFEEIARYGEDVLRRVKAALTGETDFNLEKVLDSYMGPKTAQELMDLALGHSVHHLKQLYEYMSLAGIMPEQPLGQEDFDGVAVPTELF